MRLTVIPSDKAVFIDGECYLNLDWAGTPSNVHALQWNENSGWIEFNDGNKNLDITQLPAWANNAIISWNQADYEQKNPPAPTAEQNKTTAMNILFRTDWVNQPDVTDTNKTPHLLNWEEFDAYRLQIRQIAVNPVEGEIEWPAVPVEQWSN